MNNNLSFCKKVVNHFIKAVLFLSAKHYKLSNRLI